MSCPFILQANLNSTNWKLVSAVLVGALYPNVVQVLTPESKYAQTGGGKVKGSLPTNNWGK